MVKNLLGILLISTALTGCLSTKMYVDPTLPKVTPAELKTPAEKHAVQLLYEFQSNNSLNAAATKQTLPMATSALQKSNLFTKVVSAPETDQHKLFVTINNVVDLEAAKSKGVKTGMTLGMSGSMVTDEYICEARYVSPGQEPVIKTFQHAIHSTIGNADGPQGLEPKKPMEAIQQVVEDFMLNALKDLQKEGAL